MYSLRDVLVYHHTGEDVWLRELLLKHSLLFALHVRVREVEVKMWKFNVSRTERLKEMKGKRRERSKVYLKGHRDQISHRPFL